MYLKNICIALFGFTAGGIVASGVFAFIVLAGIFTRLAARTRTSSFTNVYENAIVLGGTVGNIIFVYELSVPIHYVGLIITGLFFGIFVGCLAIALAEVLKVVPILVKRVGLNEGFPFMIFSIALGKLAGSLIQFVLNWR